MALSGSQVTQHGVTGYTQMPYGSFTGKSAQALFADIEGLVSYADLTRSIKCTSLTPERSYDNLTPKRKCDELL